MSTHVGGEQQVWYVLDEPRVRLDARAFALDEVKRGVIGHVVRVDEVRDDDCRRARDALCGHLC